MMNCIVVSKTTSFRLALITALILARCEASVGASPNDSDPDISRNHCLIVDQDRAYVVRGNILAELSISSSTQLAIRKEIPLTDNITCIGIDRSSLYASSASTIRLYARCDPSSTTFRDITFDGPVEGFAVSRGYALSIVGVGKHHYFEAMDTASAKVVGRCQVADDYVGIGVEGNVCYIADYGAGLQVINHSDPTKPFVQSITQIKDDAVVYHPLDLAVEGGFAYLACDAEPGIVTLNVRTGGAPRVVSVINMDSILEKICARRSVLLASSAVDDLYAFSTTKNGTPTGPGDWNSGSVDVPGEIWIKGEKAFVLYQDERSRVATAIMVVDISQLEQMNAVSTLWFH